MCLLLAQYRADHAVIFLAVSARVVQKGGLGVRWDDENHS